MAQTLKGALRDIRSSYRALGKIDVREVRDRAATDRPRYVADIQRARWGMLARTAASRRKAYAATFRKLLDQRRLLGKQLEVNERAGSVIEEEFIAPPHRADWPERREALEAELRRRRMPPRAISRAIGELS